MKIYRNINVLIILFITILFLSCNKQNDESYKIGAILPLTGPLAYFGEQEKPAMELAVQKLNKNGINVNIIFEDHKGTPKDGISAMQKLISQDKVNVMITQISAVSMALGPIATSNKIPLVSMAMHPDFPKISEYTFRIYESLTQETEALATFVLEDENMKNKKVAIIRINDVWGDEAATGFKNILKMKANKEIDFEESIEQSRMDFKDIISKLNSNKIDIVFIAAYGPVSTRFASQLKTTKPDIMILGTLAIAWDYLIKSSSPALENAIVSMPPYNISAQKNAEFVSEFQTISGGKLPEYEAAFSYDLIMILGKAIERHSKDKSISIERALSEIKEYEGIVGTYIFKDRATFMKEIAIRRIVNNKLTDIKVIKFY